MDENNLLVDVTSCHMLRSQSDGVFRHLVSDVLFRYIWVAFKHRWLSRYSRQVISKMNTARL